MIILFGFFLPLLFYCAGPAVIRWVLRGRSNAKVWPAHWTTAAVAATSLIALSTLLWQVTSSSYWRERTQIAWVGISAPKLSRQLEIGGSREGAFLGWPNGAMAPKLLVRQRGSGEAEIEVSVHGALVEIEDQPLNGTVITNAERVQSAPFTLLYRKHLIWPDTLAIFQRDSLTEEISLGRSPTGVTTLLPRLNAKIVALRARKSPDDAATALALEQWAATKLLAYRDRELRLLDATDLKPHIASATKLPARLRIRWPTQLIEAELSESGDALRMTFLPPWRMAVPLPELGTGAASRALVITNRPAPGESVFELPFGATAEVRAPVGMGERKGHTVFTGAHTSTQDSGSIVLPPGPVNRAVQNSHQPTGWTSSVRVPLGQLEAELATVQDLPNTSRVALIIGLAWFLFVAGLQICIGSLSRQSLWPAAGIAAVVWNLLSLRLLLAFRYSLHPTNLDSIAIGGVISAAAALVLVPSFMFLTIILYRDRFAIVEAPRKRLTMVAAYWLAAAVLALCFYFFVPTIWPNLPQRLRPSTNPGIVIFVAVAWLLFALQAIFTYRLSGADRERFGWLWVLHWPRDLIFKFAKGGWDYFLIAGKKWKYIALIWILIYGAACLFLLLATYLGPRNLIQDLVGPILLGAIPVLLWLAFSARLISSGRTAPPHVRLGLIALLLVSSAVLWPLVLRDVGGVYGTLAFVLPLAMLLLVARPNRIGLWTTAATLSCLAVIGALVASIDILPGSGVNLLERGISRYLVFRTENQAQHLLPFTQSSRDVGDGIPLQSLQNSIVHSWENVAVAHLGGWTGVHFGSAPTERSMVPQHVLQYDSTFSFFILSEYGLVGGLALLLLYGIPLFFVAASARRRFDLGHCLAFITAAALFNEALLQAAMNLGALPFAGRNLPLLSVNSTTDLLRWTLFLCLLVQAMCWRETQLAFYSPDYGFSMLRGPVPAETEREQGWPWGRAIVLGSTPSAALVLLVVLAGVAVVSNTALREPFGWDRLLSYLSRLIDEGRIGWDAQTKTITLKNIGLSLRGDTFLEQEVVRFNSLPEAERLSLSPELTAIFSNVRTLDDYDRAFARLRGNAAMYPRPLLFRVVDAKSRGSIEVPSQAAPERLQVNPAFNFRLQFSANTDVRMMPNVFLRGGPSSQGTNKPINIIGPAWVNGRWRTAVEPSLDIPWMGRLADGLQDEWSKLGPVEATQRFGTLAFHIGLQNTAMEFTARKGRQRHAELLAQPHEDGIGALPPRVALSILELPSGGVLALGGWPRMSSSPSWHSRGTGLIPPSTWIESSAPTPLALRYGNDRNFDLIEMGSAIKPLFAAAVLRRAPQLPTYFRTRADHGEDEENVVFGIPIAGPTWSVSKDMGWRDFSDYLAKSDNRYQVRLAFLGLASLVSGRPIEDTGKSPSNSESINRGAAWQRYPKFDPNIAFSAQQPKAVWHLQDSEFATYLNQMFGVRRHSKDGNELRTSFWASRGVADDYATVGARLTSVSPPAPTFRLDEVQRPRDYVTLALGGGQNRWSNVDFAAAFSTAVLGRPTKAHVPYDAKSNSSAGDAFLDVAQRLRPGLAAVVLEPRGTAFDALRNTNALGAISSFAGVKAYAKTGTLATELGKSATSRLVLVLIRWKNEAAGEIDSGVVLSLVAERVGQGVASRWLGEFIVANRDSLRELLAPRT